MKFIERTINWTCAMIFVVAVLIGFIQGEYHYEIIDCYRPVKIAFKILEPAGGAKKNASPIIFLHGIGSTKESWYDIPQIVGDRTNRRVYLLDARNHGDSEYSDCFNFDVASADVMNFMDEQGIPKAVLIGYSFGVISILKIALLWGHRVEMAFMEDMYVSRIPTEKLQDLANYIQLQEKAAEDVPVDYNDTAAYQYVMDYVKGTEIEKAALGQSTRQGLNRTLVTLVKDQNGKRKLKANVKVIYDTLQSTEKTMSENVGRYDGPAYFIYGTESPFKSSQDEKNIRKHIPKVKLIPVKGSNHAVHAMFPGDFIENVLKYLK